MTALINDLKRLGLIHGKSSDRNPGPRGGTGSSNSPSEILKRLMEKEPKLKKLLSVYKKKKKSGSKPMKAAKGGSVNIKSITKKQFLEMPNSEIDKLSFKQIQDLMRKFMPEVGEDSSDIKMRKQGGMMKKKGYAMGGAMQNKQHTGFAKGGSMKKKGYAMGGAMKKKGYAKGGAMNKRMGHTDMRKGGMFK